MSESGGKILICMSSKTSTVLVRKMFDFLSGRTKKERRSRTGETVSALLFVKIYKT